MNTPLSIQLYSLRALPGLLEVLDAVSIAGYRHVELIGSHLETATEVRKQLDARGLNASSSHVGMAALRERFDAVMAACKTLGFTQLFMPSVPPDERQNIEPYWTALGLELGQMATRARDRGIDLGYHNHHWELNMQPDGRNALECLFAGAGDAPLSWQADVAWLVRGGADPVALMQRYGSSTRMAGRTSATACLTGAAAWRRPPSPAAHAGWSLSTTSRATRCASRATASPS